jgi:polyhydroxyalkanoate synthesis repressor PhaR
MVVKRYSNRRLYDTVESRYVTLDEVAVRIRGGEDVQFVDAPTGEDITQSFLAQIILEGRGAAKLLPVPLLYRLVRMGDDALAEFFGRYVSWALEVYLKMKQGARANPLMAVPMAASDAVLRWLGGFGSMPPSQPQQGWGRASSPYPPPPMPDDPPEPPWVAGAADKFGGGAGGAPSPEDARQDEELASLRAELDGLKRIIREAMGGRRDG